MGNRQCAGVTMRKPALREKRSLAQSSPSCERGRVESSELSLDSLWSQVLATVSDGTKDSVVVRSGQLEVGIKSPDLSILWGR